MKRVRTITAVAKGNYTVKLSVEVTSADKAGWGRDEFARTADRVTSHLMATISDKLNIPLTCVKVK